MYSASDRRQPRSFSPRFRTKRSPLRLELLEIRTQLPRLQAIYQHASTLCLLSRGQLAVVFGVPHRLGPVRIGALVLVWENRKPWN